MTRMLILYLLLLSTSLNAQNDQNIIQALGKHGLITYAIVDLSDGKLLYERNPDLLVPPASTLKMLTTLSALDILGSDYTYQTSFYASGERNNSVLIGDLILEGGGDPTLGSKYFQPLSITQLADQLSEALITNDIVEISGDLIIDDGFYTGYVQNPDWLYRDLGNYYGCGLWSINVQDNMGTITFQRSTIAHSNTKILKTHPELIPASSYQNEVRIGAAGSGDQAYIYGTHSNDQWTIKGTLPPSNKTYTIKSALSNVPSLLAQALTNSLDKYGISLRGQVIVSNSLDRKTSKRIIWKHQSPSLLDISKVTNEESVNLFAEALIQTIGSIYPDPDLYYPNSLESGVNHSISHWNAQGIDIGFFNWYDGSGLSPINGVSARAFAQIIHHFWSQGEDSRMQLQDILAEAGKEGTLKSVCSPSSNLYGNMWAKSGTIAHTKAYTGVLKSQSGKYYGFYINASRIPEGKSRAIRNAMMGFLEDVVAKH